MKPPTVVKDLYVFEDLLLCLFTRMEVRGIYQLSFQGTKELTLPPKVGTDSELHIGHCPAPIFCTRYNERIFCYYQAISSVFNLLVNFLFSR